jgi:hypothetical protein
MPDVANKSAYHIMTSELQDKITQLLQILARDGIDYGKFKRAYPNYDQYMYVPSPHNTQKWMEAVKQIYRMETSGHNRIQSIRQITASWPLMETHDFLNWLRYYEQGAHLKYKMIEGQKSDKISNVKTAQLWYENGAPGYFLHVKQDSPKEPEPQVDGNQIDFARETAVKDSDKREIIEKQRNKIIGRLDSAEKLLRAPDGQTFAGPELEALMEAIYQLKKKIQLVNKMSTSTRLYEDMIVREANVLHRGGFVKAATWLHAQAQANNPPPAGLGKSGDIETLPSPQSPESPSAPLHPGMPGGLPSMGPGMPQNAPSDLGVPEAGPNDNEPANLQGVSKTSPPTVNNGPPTLMPQEAPSGISEFLDRMNEGKSDTATVEDDMLEVTDADSELLVTEAQFVPPIDEPITTSPAVPRGNPAPPPKPKKPSIPTKSSPSLEVSEDDIEPVPEEPIPDTTEVDQRIDDVFKNISTEDIIKEVDAVARIFRLREIPRRISRIDLMLNGKGISSYFPTVGEMLQKQLDANNYCSTRIEEMLSKLRGTLSSADIDLEKGDENAPEMEGVKNKLQQDQDKEKARKQQRKQQSDAELEASPGKETPEVEIAEDLKPPPSAAPPPVPRPIG